MGLDELAGERQAKTKCRLTAGAGAMKAGEDLRLVFLGDTGTIVDDRHNRLFVIPARLQPDMAAFLGIGDGVAQNMLNGLPEPPGIASVSDPQ